MIRNPYAKAPPKNPNAASAAPSPAAKRPRPWSGEVENEPRTSRNLLPLEVPARPPTAASSLRHHATSHVPALPLEERNHAHAIISSNGGNNPGLDDDDDYDYGGIDWDAAVLELDDTASSKPGPTAKKSVISTADNHSKTESRRTVDLTASPNTKTRNPTTATHQDSTVPFASVFEKPPLSSKVVAASSPSLASLQPPAMLQRPAAWTSTAPTHASTGTAVPGSPATSNAGTAVDPRQASLPAFLQFNPSQVKPVADEHRSLLVKNANLSAPLLNGWTLFSHQKKAILRGLLMRRMILALDMGLGYVTRCMGNF
jgi:hypothetical protein